MSEKRQEFFGRFEGASLICALKSQKSSVGSTSLLDTTDVKDSNTPRNQTPDVKSGMFPQLSKKMALEEV